MEEEKKPLDVVSPPGKVTGTLSVTSAASASVEKADTEEEKKEEAAEEGEK
jgi:hypothetical protein